MMVINVQLNVKFTALLFSISFFLFFDHVSSQGYSNTDVPVIGEKFDFSLSGVKNYNSSTISGSGFRGKYVILDFFSSGCASCFASFPHIKSFQGQYQDKMQFVLIGYDDKYIRKQFEFYKKKLDLKLPYLYDTLFANRVVPIGFPHLIWIDSAGVVRAVTGSSALTEANVQNFLSNQTFSFLDQSHSAVKKRENAGMDPNIFDWRYQVDPKTRQRVERLVYDTNSLFKSEFGRFNSSMSRGLTARIDKGPLANRAIQGIGTPEQLYLYAYFGATIWYNMDSDGTYEYLYGNYYPKVITEVSDTAAFQGSISSLKNVYWYVLKNLKSGPDSLGLHNQMKRDLKGFFGYDAKVEKRVCPCYKLVASKGAINKLKSKGGESYFDISNSYFKLSNRPFKIIVSTLIRHDLSGEINIPIVDSTGIDLEFKVDFDIETNLFDINAVNSELKRYGLEIIYQPKEMSALVIKD